MEPVSLSSLQAPCIIFLIGLCARAVFSFLETSITALRLFKLKELAASTAQYKSLFYALEKNPHRVLVTILVANSLADVTVGAMAPHITETLFMHFNLSRGLGFSLGMGVATIAILVFGEIIPKNIARVGGDTLFRSSLWLANLVFYTLYPVVAVLIKFSDYLIYKISGKPLTEETTEWVSSEKEIQFLINYIQEKGLMETEKTMMLHNIFELGRTPVREILIPTSDIVSVAASMTSSDSVPLFLQHGFTRLPVYEERADNIIGMVYLKDVFALMARNEQKTLKDIMRPVMFVPETVKVNQLLREFRQQHMHLAIVLDEHGSLSGLITLEDVLEEIVGEINDEYELASEKIVPLKNNSWLVRGSTPLQEVEKVLNIVFDTQDCLTLGGFLTEKLQHLPKKGERILYEGFYFQVQKATPRRVLELLVSKADRAEPVKSESGS